MPAESFEEEGLERIPDLRLSQWLFQASLNRTTAKSRSLMVNLIMDIVKSESMAPFYKIVCKQLHLLESQQLIGEMQKANDEKLRALDGNIKMAEESDGETEIREAMIAKAHYLSKIGSKTVLPGCRLDITFHLIRMGFFHNDRDLITTNIEKANSLIEEGGDWDRRNRLKVYRGLHSLSIRDFNASAKHFLDAVATFTSYELMDYKSFIIYTVLTSMIALKRQDLRAKVIMGSEIQEVLHSLPAVREYLMSLFECRYADFFLYLAGVEQFMHSDRYLAAHARYYVREMRIRAYTQHLDSYSSLSLESMAATFGVTMNFLDAELSRFIANGRIACKIDKVTGIVETTRPDNVNSQYQAMIKHGDVLLNRIQKLSQVINI
ncbi:26S proteasome non-ATPase regulatory subunit 6 [Taenia crassiceps]|uniref:26S proteasome non-ATPase regulatory subunit 6 n=1 Tax=Taenia crassiceps TaxID=6207 RepID=A0ABR4QMV5_9CEST